jgi:hypothetical protein
VFPALLVVENGHGKSCRMTAGIDKTRPAFRRGLPLDVRPLLGPGVEVQTAEDLEFLGRPDAVDPGPCVARVWVPGAGLVTFEKGSGL